MIRANMEVLIFTLEYIGWIQTLFLWTRKISDFWISTTPSDSPTKMSQKSKNMGSRDRQILEKIGFYNLKTFMQNGVNTVNDKLIFKIHFLQNLSVTWPHISRFLIYFRRRNEMVKTKFKNSKILKPKGIKFESNHSKCNLALYYACIICTSDWSFSYPWLRGFRCGLISNVSLCLKLTFIDQGQRSTKKWTYTLRHKVDQIHLVEGWCSSVTNFRLILI